MAKLIVKSKKAKCFLVYVDDSSPVTKTFDNKKEAWKFVEEFHAAHPNPHDGYWVYYLVTGIRCKINYLDSSSEE